jgi:tRNA(adenine34) deaminase
METKMALRRAGRKAAFMALALEEAEAAARAGEVPVGAILVAEGRLIARAGNRVLALRDPTAHAEMLVLRAGAEALGSERLSLCDLYVTLEPCAMCAGAISLARIRRLYYGAGDPKGGAVEHGARFFTQTTCHHKPEIYSGFSAREAGDLLRAFFAGKRD